MPQVTAPNNAVMAVFYDKKGKCLEVRNAVTDEEVQGVPAPKPDAPKEDSGWIDPSTGGGMDPICFWFLNRLYCIGQ